MKAKTKINIKNVGKTVGNYPIGDFLTRVKNAGLAGNKTVVFPQNKFVVSVAKCLEKEGYLRDIAVEQGILTVNLSYQKKEPVVTDIKLVSKPGKRVYMKIEDLEKIKSPWILILSTPNGIFSLKDALKKKQGGEVIAKIL